MVSYVGGLELLEPRAYWTVTRCMEIQESQELRQNIVK